MTINDAIRVLKEYQVWRRYDGPIEDTPVMPQPKIIGEALDTVIEHYENTNENSVMPETVKVSFEDLKRIFREIGQELDERRKPDPIPTPSFDPSIMPQTFWPPCFYGGQCTNPHHDCINCPNQCTGGGRQWSTNAGSTTIKPNE